MATSFNLLGSFSCSSNGHPTRWHARASPLLPYFLYCSSTKWVHHHQPSSEALMEAVTFSAQIRGSTCLVYEGRKNLLSPSKRLNLGLCRAFRGGGGGGSGGKEENVGRTVFNLGAAGVLTYLTVSGSFNWLFEGISFLLIFFWVTRSFLQRQLIKGTCPNCGSDFDVLEFSMQEVPRLCPFCSQPFRLENKQFVREEPHFSTQQKRDFRRPFKGFQQSSSPKKQEGVIVDIEAEVFDKD